MTTAPGKLLCVDHGRKVLGLATSDAIGLLATPHSQWRRKTRVEDFAHIAALAAEVGALEIIVGVPLPPPDFVGYSQADTVHRWASRLAAAVPIPVRLWDETLSSEEAARLLDEADRTRPSPRADDAAAAVILQSYLDSLKEGFPIPPAVAPLDE